MLKSDIRAFSYENIKPEGSGELQTKEKKQLAISFQFSLSISTGSVLKAFIDFAKSRYIFTKILIFWKI